MVDRLTLRQRARGLRAAATPAERVLWNRLRLRQVEGTRFLRQYVIGHCIVDFFAPSVRVAVELDGGQHFEVVAHARDETRTAWLRSQGVRVVRYSNLEVLQRLDDVLEDLRRTVLRGRAEPGHLPAPAARPPSFRRG